MKNFPFKHEGKTYWYSRGIVCAVFIFAPDESGDIHVLANKRGTAVIETGKWNCPCGHLDFDETCVQCAVRETFEETGVRIEPERLNLLEINDHDFISENQTIGFIYYALIDDRTIEDMPTSKAHMEKNEVEEIQWIDVDELDAYDWTFNHDGRIRQILGKIGQK